MSRPTIPRVRVRGSRSANPPVTGSTSTSRQNAMAIAGAAGQGSGAVSLLVSANPAAQARSSVVTIAGQPYVIEQAGGSILNADATGVTGCSRFGKGAFVAGAFDQRIALTMPIESGSAGVPIFRGIPGEGAQSRDVDPDVGIEVHARECGRGRIARIECGDLRRLGGDAAGVPPRPGRVRGQGRRPAAGADRLTARNRMESAGVHADEVVHT